jgi:stage IV sporulation protein FB
LIKSPFPFPIRIHLLTWVLFATAVVTGQFAQLVTLFLIVFVHELGHVLAAYRYRWSITELTILPFGGVVKMNPPGRENGWEEFWIALAGPISNGVMVLFALLLYGFHLITWDYAHFFMIGNLSIAFFNLLPIYPLDGGRVLQVLLSFWLPFKKAILLSLYLGVILILLLFLLSFWRISLGPELWLILPYLLMMIFVERRRVPYRLFSFLFSRYAAKKRPLLPTRYLHVRSGEPLKNGTEKMYRHRYHLFKVRETSGQKKVIYYPEQRILYEMFERKRPLITFAEIEKDVHLQ